MFLALDGADDLPAETRLYGATDRVETGSYTLRPFGRPVIDGYFGGAFARELESQGDGAFAAFAIEQICAALGNDMRKRLRADRRKRVGARSVVARRVFVWVKGRAGRARDTRRAGERQTVLRRRALLGCGFLHRARRVSDRREGGRRRDQGAGTDKLRQA